eukprot:COSAG06_NODE_63678_length_261_cov_1.592593_1_plen_70_part_01
MCKTRYALFWCWKRHFLMEIDQTFAKTGSGQTQRKLSLKGRFPQVERQMQELREFMVQKRVPKHLRKSVR